MSSRPRRTTGSLAAGSGKRLAGMLAPRTEADGAVPGPPPASALATKASAASAPNVRPAAPIATLERLQYSQSIWLPLATARHVLAGRRAGLASGDAVAAVGAWPTGMTAATPVPPAVRCRPDPAMLWPRWPAAGCPRR